MRTILLITVAALFVIAPAQAQDSWQKISASIVYSQLQGGGAVRLLDVRNRSDFDGAHIEGAMNISSLDIAYRSLPIGKTYVVVDNSLGNIDAVNAAAALIEKGHGAVYVLDGGIAAWYLDGHPLVGDRALVDRAVTARQLLDAMQRKIRLSLFDVRSPEHYEAGHIAGAVLVDGRDSVERIARLRSMLAGVSALSPGLPEQVVLVLDRGSDAERLITMVAAGAKYDIRYLDGGYEMFESLKRGTASLRAGEPNGSAQCNAPSAR